MPQQKLNHVLANRAKHDQRRNRMNPNVPAAIIAAILCAIVLLIAPSRSKADEWNNTDKALMASLVVMDLVDIAQTRKCMKLPNCHEANPLLGKHPSDTTLVASKALSLGAIYWLVDTYPQIRPYALVGANVLQFVVIRHNYVGTHLGWGF